MTLIPSDMMVQMKETPLIAHMSMLDLEMDKILKDNQLPMDQKFRQYQTALYRYHISQQERDKPTLPLVTEPTHKRFPKDQLLSDIPQQKRRNAKLLIEFIENIPELSLTDKNEIQINGKTVLNSNIVDLFADLSRDRKDGPPPRGYDELMTVLNRHNIPLEAIGNRRRRDTMIPDDVTTPAKRQRRRQSSLEDEEPPLTIERKSSRIAKGRRKNYAVMARGQPWEPLYKKN